MFSLYNIVFDTIASVVVCVDFLGTHTASLVLFFKTECDMLSRKKYNKNKTEGEGNINIRHKSHRYQQRLTQIRDDINQVFPHNIKLII